jgi:hypothetical protein
MNDFDRYDYINSAIAGLFIVGILLLGGPLWVLVPICMVCATISLYRHLDLPPRRR